MLVIAQSGDQLDVTIGRSASVKLKGTLTGTNLVAEGVLPVNRTPSSAECVGGDSLRLLARVFQEPTVK